MAQKLKNNARSLLVSAINAGNTSLVVESGKADLFPVADTGTDPVGTFGKDWFKAVLQDTAGNIEIIYVRTRTGGNATLSNILRGQEGTTARDYAAGSVVGLRITSKDVEDAISLASSATATGKAIVGAANQAAARGAIGATTTGQAVMTAADGPAARSAIGALGASDNIASSTNSTNATNLVGSGTISDDSKINGEKVGYRSIPPNSKSANYILALADNGESIVHPAADTSARTWTIPANASVAFPVGSAITLINEDGAGAITVAITSDTLYQAGIGATGSRTLAAGGMATIVKVAATKWFISGAGLT